MIRKAKVTDLDAVAGTYKKLLAYEAGYGRKMVQFAIKYAVQMGGKAIRLDTWAENKPAAELYRSFGFEYAGRYIHC